MVTPATMKEARKVATVLEKSSKEKFLQTLMVLAVPQITGAILEDYDSRLVAAVTDRKSRTRPDLYRDAFVDRLFEFDYIKETPKGATLCTPDMDNFNFSGQLRIIENILNGTAGVHVEVDEEQYVQMYSRQPRLTDLFDPDLPKKKRIYLLRLTVDVRNRLRNNNIDLVRFPFSNTPSIDIFGTANSLVEDNLGMWVDDTLTEVIKVLGTAYGRQ